ncbi:hypothetical protein ACQ4PT_007639 [Festuca glaucescens]
MDNLHWEVVSFAESAVGLGLFRMVGQVTRDLLVALPQIQFGVGRTLSFTRHDEGPNFRASVYTSLGWIMLLNLPMDYRNEEFLRETVGKFGKMRGWFGADPSPTRMLIKCAYAGARDVPRSIVVRDPQRHGGTVVSWTVPVFIMLTDQADVLPGDESPIPHDGIPHPLPDDAEGGDQDWIPDDVEPKVPGGNSGTMKNKHDVAVPGEDDMEQQELLAETNPLAIVPFVQQGDISIMPQTGMLLPNPFVAWTEKQKETKVVDVIDLSSRRCTRSIAQNDGYKLTPMTDKPEPRKKPKSVKAKVVPDKDVQGTPVKVLQQAGKWLEIDEKNLSVDKLMAHPQPQSKKPSGSDV